MKAVRSRLDILDWAFSDGGWFFSLSSILIFRRRGLRQLLVRSFLLHIPRFGGASGWIRGRCCSALTCQRLLGSLLETLLFKVFELFDELAQVVLGFSNDKVSLELLKALGAVDDVGAWEESFGSFSFRVTVLHREPVGHVDVAPVEAFFKA